MPAATAELMATSHVRFNGFDVRTLLRQPRLRDTTFYFTKRLGTQAPPLRCQQTAPSGIISHRLDLPASTRNRRRDCLQALSLQAASTALCTRAHSTQAGLPAASKKQPQCDASADVACKPSPCKPLRLRHAGRLAAAPTSTRNRRLQRDAERAACNATQCAPIASTLLRRPSGARVSRICVLLRLIQSVCDQLLHIAGIFWCGCSRLFRFRFFCFQRWDSDCGRRVRGVVTITAGIA